MRRVVGDHTFEATGLKLAAMADAGGKCDWKNHIIPAKDSVLDVIRVACYVHQISEAVEMAVNDPDTKYALGSVLNHVLMHQTIVGQEAVKQMEKAGDLPDIIVAPFGGGSNFAGLCFPFLRMNLEEGKNIRCIASEPASCPKLTRGQFRYDFGDSAGYTPLIPMFTLGHTFRPAAIHAGGLRYHGASALCSQLLRDKLIEAVAIQQLECFKAGLIFTHYFCYPFT